MKTCFNVLKSVLRKTQVFFRALNLWKGLNDMVSYSKSTHFSFYIKIVNPCIDLFQFVFCGLDCVIFQSPDAACNRVGLKSIIIYANMDSLIPMEWHKSGKLMPLHRNKFSSASGLDGIQSTVPCEPLTIIIDKFFLVHTQKLL